VRRAHRWLGLGLLLWPALAAAQLQDSGMHIRMSSNPSPEKVQLLVAVDAPHDGAIGPSPAAGNFTVWLNQGAARDVTVVRNSNRKQATIILIDESGSYRLSNGLWDTVAVPVVTAVVNAVPSDRYGLLLFGSAQQRVAVRGNAGDFLKDLAAAPGRPKAKTTNLIPGLLNAIEWASQEGAPGQREVILLSDAGDETTMDDANWARVLAEAKKNLVRVSVVISDQIPDKMDPLLFNGVRNKLRAIAQDTAGVYDESSKPAQIIAALKAARAAAKTWLVMDGTLCGMKPGAGADVRVEYAVGGQRKAWSGATQLEAGAWAPATQTTCPSQCSVACAVWEECVAGVCAALACSAQTPCPGGAMCSGGKCAKACTGCKPWQDCVGGACTARTCTADEQCGGARCSGGVCGPAKKSFLQRYLILLLGAGGGLLLLIAALVLLRKKPAPPPPVFEAPPPPPEPIPEPEARPAIGTGPVLDPLPETHLEAVSGWITPGERWRLFKPKMAVGGSKDPGDNDIVFDIKQVSSRHALFELYPSGDIWVTDLGARNGTWVNGRQLVAKERCKIKPGDQIKLSQQLMLRVVRPGVEAAPDVASDKGLSGAGPGGARAPEPAPEQPPKADKKKTRFDPGNR